MSNKFHIKITNNETGEVIHDSDTCAIFGGYAKEDGAVGMACAHCGPVEHAKAMHAAETSIKEVYRLHPELKLMVLLTEARSTVEERREE